MSHVFVSYLHEDDETVDRLCADLSAEGIDVWRDRERIQPGQRWKQVISEAIRNGAYFIACFSTKYAEKKNSHMNEELTVAIEELRRMPTERVWFIPVTISECEIPDRAIGAGESIRDLQWINLQENWQSGIRKIVEVIAPRRKRVQSESTGRIAGAPKAQELSRTSEPQAEPTVIIDFERAKVFNVLGDFNRHSMTIHIDERTLGIKGGERKRVKVTPGPHLLWASMVVTFVDNDMEMPQMPDQTKEYKSKKLRRDFSAGEEWECNLRFDTRFIIIGDYVIKVNMRVRPTLGAVYD